MNREKASMIVLSVLLLVMAVGLGFLWGYHAAPSEISITTVSESSTITALEEALHPPGPVDLNTATVEELEQLPGIGSAIAERIIQYRQENGLFTSIDQVMNVEGIGEKKFEAMKEYISIGGK